MNKAFDVASAIVMVAMISVLVKKGSQGPAFVSNVGTAFANVLKAANP